MWEVAPSPSSSSPPGGPSGLRLRPLERRPRGGDTGNRTVATIVGRATMLVRGRRPWSPRGAGLLGGRLLARSGRVSWAGELWRPRRVPPVPRVAGDVSAGGGGGGWSRGTDGSDVGSQRPGHGGGGGGGSCCLSRDCGRNEVEPGARALEEVRRQPERERPEPGEGPRPRGAGFRGAPRGAGSAREAAPEHRVPFPLPGLRLLACGARVGGLCLVTMTTPANAQNASKTWELSLYELHRTPQVTGILPSQLTPSRQTPNPQTPSHLFFSILCSILSTLLDFAGSL